jgi:hypothetical protein
MLSLNRCQRIRASLHAVGDGQVHQLAAHGEPRLPWRRQSGLFFTAVGLVAGRRYRRYRLVCFFKQRVGVALGVAAVLEAALEHAIVLGDIDDCEGVVLDHVPYGQMWAGAFDRHNLQTVADDYLSRLNARAANLRWPPLHKRDCTKAMVHALVIRMSRNAPASYRLQCR